MPLPKNSISAIIHKYSFLKCCSTVRNCVLPLHVLVRNRAALEKVAVRNRTRTAVTTGLRPTMIWMLGVLIVAIGTQPGPYLHAHFLFFRV